MEWLQYEKEACPCSFQYSFLMSEKKRVLEDVSWLSECKDYTLGSQDAKGECFCLHISRVWCSLSVIPAVHMKEHEETGTREVCAVPNLSSYWITVAVYGVTLWVIERRNLCILCKRETSSETIHDQRNQCIRAMTEGKGQSLTSIQVSL